MIELVLLPGLLCDATVWRAQADGLSDIALPIVVDYGARDSLTAMAECALDSAPKRFALAGHSMGARVALEVMRIAPERVEHLALLDTGIHTLRPGETEKRMQLVELAYREGMAALCDAWLPPMVHPDRVQDSALMQPLREMVTRFTPERHEAQIRALLNRPDPAPLLSAITCPTLVGVGRQDAWSPPAQHEAIAQAVPGANLIVFEHAGHFAPCEAPDQVTTAMRAWLSA
ncbi:MAG: alpha/beta fold hydrolase [Hyphomonadaceae bacterium]|nr:alpha/beta fold hydrolase [Hyphomonadaceae bacterium]